MRPSNLEIVEVGSGVSLIPQKGSSSGGAQEADVGCGDDVDSGGISLMPQRGGSRGGVHGIDIG